MSDYLSGQSQTHADWSPGWTSVETETSEPGVTIRTELMEVDYPRLPLLLSAVAAVSSISTLLAVLFR